MSEDSYYISVLYKVLISNNIFGKFFIILVQINICVDHFSVYLHLIYHLIIFNINFNEILHHHGKFASYCSHK